MRIQSSTGVDMYVVHDGRESLVGSVDEAKRTCALAALTKLDLTPVFTPDKAH